MSRYTPPSEAKPINAESLSGWRETLELNDKLLEMNQILIDNSKKSRQLILGAADQIEMLQKNTVAVLKALEKMRDLGMLPKITVELRDTLENLQRTINGNTIEIEKFPADTNLFNSAITYLQNNNSLKGETK